MKNIITISLTFLIWGNVYTQYTQVTDTVFEKYLINRGWDDTLDGRISNSNVKDIKYLDFGDYGKIKSLSGIEAFKSLETLYCFSQQLKSLNLTENLNLKTLIINNYLNNQKGEYNKTEIKILNLNNNYNLENLTCTDVSIEELLISSCRNLKSLDCSNNKIESLDLSNCKNLESLNCSNNKIKSLNLSNCNNLESLDCSINEIKKLDIHNLQESCVSFSTNPVRKIIFKSQHCNENILKRIFSSKIIKEDNLLILVQNPCYELDFENFKVVKFTCR